MGEPLDAHLLNRQLKDFLLTVTLNTADLLIVMVDPHGRIVLFNRACQEVTGYSAQEAAGRFLWDVLSSEAMTEPTKQIFQRVCAGQVNQGAQHRIPCPTPEGRERLIVWRYTTLQDKANRIQYVVGMGRDITTEDHLRAERQYLHEALHEANARLQRLLQAREDIIQNLSHELRTPLTLVLGYAEALDAGLLGTLAAEQQEALRVVLKHARRLHSLIERLLILQALALDASKPQRMPLGVDTLIAFIVDKWRSWSARERVDLQVDISRPAPQVSGDPDLLVLMLDILVENAIKFSARGGRLKVNGLDARTSEPPPSRKVTIQVWTEGTEARVAVTDEGIGIAADELPLIFEPFYQTDKGTARQYDGIGIGLALCRAIVEAHGGRIWAESAGPGQGSTFHVALPRVLPSASEAPYPFENSPDLRIRDHLHNMLAR